MIGGFGGTWHQFLLRLLRRWPHICASPTYICMSQVNIGNPGSWTAPALATHLCITHTYMHAHIAQYSLCTTHVYIHVHIALYRLIRGSETAPALATHLCITHVCIHVYIVQYRLIRGSWTAPALATHLCITHVCMHVYIAQYRLIRGSVWIHYDVSLFSV